MLYINNTVKINNEFVKKDNLVFFENKEEKTSAYFKSIYKHLNIKYMKYFKMDNLSKLGFLSAEVLLKNADLSKKYLPEEIALVITNSYSSVDIDRKFYKTVIDENDIPAPAQFVYTLPNILIGEICIRNNFKGETAFLINNENPAKQLVEYTENMFLLNKKIKACILGSIEFYDQNNYCSSLFLVESVENNENSINFDVLNIEKIYNL